MRTKKGVVKFSARFARHIFVSSTPSLQFLCSPLEVIDVALEDGEIFVSLKKSLQTCQAGFVPKNTAVNTKWAVKN